MPKLKSLNAIGSNPQKGIAEFQALYKLYLTQDSDALYALAAAQLKAEGYSQSKMLDNRNQKWIPAIEKNIAENRPSSLSAPATSAERMG